MIDLDWGDAAMFLFGWIVGIGWGLWIIPKYRRKR